MADENLAPDQEHAPDEDGNLTQAEEQSGTGFESAAGEGSDHGSYAGAAPSSFASASGASATPSHVSGHGHSTGSSSRTGGAARWIPPTPAELQPMFAGYELLALVGQGGMGAVYQARQSTLDRIVAIKLLPLELAEDEVEFAARFENEARLLAKLNHPGIVRVFEFGQTPAGQMFMVMEYVEGTDVAHLLKPMQPLPPEHATSILLQMCDALGYAHGNHVIHRDIKPSNVMLNAEGRVKVMDFGLAKNVTSQSMALTKSHMVMGTPDYIAPEALLYGVQADHRADIYALGVMFYQMLTGMIPRGKYKAPSERVAALDTRFDLIVSTCMAENPLERYQDITGLKRTVEKALQSGPQPVRAPVSTAAPEAAGTGGDPAGRRMPRSQPVSRRVPIPQPASSGGGASFIKVAAVLVLGVASYFIWQEMRQPPQAVASSTPAASGSVPSAPMTGEAGSSDGSSVDIAPASPPQPGTAGAAAPLAAAVPMVAAPPTSSTLPTAPVSPASAPAPATMASASSSGENDTFNPAIAAPAPGMVPELITPTKDELLDNGGGMPMFDPKDWRFVWTPVNGASEYEIEVNKIGIPRPVLKTTVTVPYYRQSSMGYFPGSTRGSALWKVRAKVNGEWQPWSEERANLIEAKDEDVIADIRAATSAAPVSSLPANVAALVPQLDQPAAAAVVDNGNVSGPSADLREWSFNWGEVPGATQYRLFVHRDDPERYAVFGNMTGTSYRLGYGSIVPGDQLTGWAWRVAAKVNGVWQPWSDARHFTVEQPGTDPDPASPPGADPSLTPRLTFPSNGGRLENTSSSPGRVSVNLRLNWQTVPGATRYHIYVMHPDGDRAWVNFSTTFVYYNSMWTTDVRSTVPLMAKWKVRAEVNGQWQAWSEERTFGFRAPGEPDTPLASAASSSAPGMPGANAPDPGVARAWTDQRGRVVTAKFGGLQGDRMIMILPNGNSVPVPLSSLSAESQQAARDMAAARTAGAPGAPAAPAPAPGAATQLLDAPKDSEDHLKITGFKPRTPGTLKMGERLTVSVRYDNPIRESVTIWITPIINGMIAPNSGTSGSYLYDRGSGRVERWIFFNSATTIDAVQIRMVNATTKETIALIQEPVSFTWK